MSLNQISNILNSEIEDIAFVIGNGINLHNGSNNLSWINLLKSLWQNITGKSEDIPNGISLTEYYDIIELKNSVDKKKHEIQIQVRDLLKHWEPMRHHREILSFIQYMNCPILTTNFDEVLKRALNLEQFKIDNERLGFTDYYPWDTYHAYNKLNYPTDGFGIWYVNGMIRYHRSIRLGLTHYMGSVERARKIIHADDAGIFRGKNQNHWIGFNTWLHIIFNKSLIVFGLSLNAQETFLRWLLLERARYFKRFSDQSYNGWYIYNESEEDLERTGKHFFLEQVGIEPIALNSYDEMYKEIWAR